MWSREGYKGSNPGILLRILFGKFSYKLNFPTAAGKFSRAGKVTKGTSAQTKARSSPAFPRLDRGHQPRLCFAELMNLSGTTIPFSGSDFASVVAVSVVSVVQHTPRGA